MNDQAGGTPEPRRPADAEGFAPRPTASELVDLLGMARTLWRAKWLLVGAALVFTVAAYAAMLTVPPRYTAEARVQLDPRAQQLIDIENVLSEAKVNEATVFSEIGVLQSAEILRPVARNLGLDRLPEYNPDLRAPSATGASASGSGGEAAGPVWTPEMIAADILADDVDVAQLGLSFTIRIIVSAATPQLAADIANEIAAVYLRAQVDRKLAVAQEATAWLAERVETLRQRVEALEREVERRRLEIAGGGRASAVAIERQIGELSTRLVLARIALSEATARKNRFATLHESGNLGAAMQIASSETLDRLVERRSGLVQQRETLARTSGPTTDTRQIDENLAAIDAAIRSAVGEIALGLNATVEIARAQIDEQERELAALEAAQSEQASALIALRPLESEAQAQRGVYETFLNRLTGARERGAFQQPDALIVAVASPPMDPSGPRRAPVAIVAGMFGGSLAAAAALVRAAMRDRIETLGAAAAAAGADALAALPPAATRVAPGAALTRLVVAPPAPVDRAARRAQVALWRDGAAGTPRTVLVCSPGEDEGGPIAAALLARACAAAGLATALVDCDRSGRSALRQFNPGGAQMAPIAGAGVDIVTPPASASTEAIVAALAALSASHAAIVVAGPPVLSAIESLSLAPAVDRVALVARLGETRTAATREAAADLRRFGGRLAGVIATDDPAAAG